MKTQNKLFVFNLIVMIIIIVTSFYVVAKGDTYDLHSKAFYDESVRDSIKVHIFYSEEGIIDYVNYRFDDDELI